MAGNRESLLGKDYYESIDGLRVLAAVNIILMHVWANGHYSASGFLFNRLIPSFSNFVFLFMIISGFSMCCGYYEKVVKNKISLDEFYRKRYAKIWPCFVLLSLLDLMISPSIEALYEVFANMTLCFGLLPDPKMSVIGVGWFLGVIFIFYMVFPFFCYLLANKKRAWFSFVVALIFNELCSIYFNAERENFVYSAVFFFAGGLVYLYRDLISRVANKYRWLILLLCLIMACGYYKIGASVLIMLMLFTLLLIYGIGSTGCILKNPLTKFLSGISLEIYLCHMVVFRAIEKVGLTHLFKLDVWSYIVTALGTIIGAVLFSVMLTKGLEFVKRRIKK